MARFDPTLHRALQTAAAEWMGKGNAPSDLLLCVTSLRGFARGRTVTATSRTRAVQALAHDDYEVRRFLNDPSADEARTVARALGRAAERVPVLLTREERNGTRAHDLAWVDVLDG